MLETVRRIGRPAAIPVPRRQELKATQLAALVVLTWPLAGLGETPAAQDGQPDTLYGAWTQNLDGANPNYRKASVTVIYKNGWIWSEITQKGEPAAVSMVVDGAGKCHVLGFPEGTTCEMNLLPQSADITVNFPGGDVMEQHWRLDKGGKTFLQTFGDDDSEDEASAKWVRLAHAPEPQ